MDTDGHEHGRRPSGAHGHRLGVPDFSSEEQLHARLAYLRAPGNVDLDRDPSSFSSVAAESDPLVICRR
jgi:hypothetical protein